MNAPDKKRHAAVVKECAALPEPVSAADYYRWGYSLLRLERYRDACSVLDRAIALYPEDPEKHEFLSYLGQAHLALGDYVKAADCFRASVEIFPKSPDVHSFLGDAFRLSGQTGKATKAYRQAMSLALPGEPAADRAQRGLEQLTTAGRAARKSTARKRS